MVRRFSAPARSALRREQIYDALDLSPLLREAFDSEFPVFTDATVVISKQFAPWYGEARETRTNMYWDTTRLSSGHQEVVSSAIASSMPRRRTSSNA